MTPRHGSVSTEAREECPPAEAAVVVTVPPPPWVGEEQIHQGGSLPCSSLLSLLLYYSTSPAL
jgi:hypothetical protein